MDERSRILRGNAVLANMPARDMSGIGRIQLRIPDQDLAALYRKYPELAAPDKEIQKRAWARFAKSSESQPYRVNHRKGKGPW